MTMSVIRGSPRRFDVASLWGSVVANVRAEIAGVQRASSRLSLVQLGSQPVRDRRPHHIGCARGGHHADMAERRPQDVALPGGCGERLGRARRHDPVAARAATTRAGRRRACGTTELAARPATGLGRSLSRYQERRSSRATGCAKRHPVVDPILERDEAARSSPSGSRPANRMNLRYARNGIEAREQSLDRRRPAPSDPTVEASEAVGSEGRGARLCLPSA